MKRLAALLVILLVSMCPETADASPGSWDEFIRGGGVVVDQPPTRYGGPGSDTAFYYPFPPHEAWQQVADNILLDTAASIRRVTWWGFYGGSGTPTPPPPALETMRVRFYDARPGDGLPWNVLYEESFLNPSRTATGEIILVGGSPDEYIYEVDLAAPVPLGAQIPYWLEIVQIGDIDSAFRWEDGFGLEDGKAVKNMNFPEWQFLSSGSLGFQLSTIPEPGSVLLICLGGALVWMRRAGRRCRG